MPLDIRVLGPLEVLVDGLPVRVDTRKAVAIVALLAVEGRPYARDELAAMFWPEADDESARGAFRRTLSVLRSALGERWLLVDRSAVALPVGGDVTLDLVQLDLAAAAGDRSGLAAAAALARGPFLAGFSLRGSPDFDDWRATRAVSVERRVVDVLGRLTAAAEADGDIGAAADAASRLVELDPLDEPARRRLMAILARSGDRAGAIRLYRSTVATLERELGVQPLAETTELYEAIRDDRFATSSSLSGHTPAPSAAPPAVPAAIAAAPASLPMVGRDMALARLVEAHAGTRVDGRVATIRGEAGIGKSRLVEALSVTVAARGGRTLAARAFPGEGAIAYAPIADLLRAGLALEGSVARLADLPATVLADVARIVQLPPGLVAVEVEAGGASPAARARLLDAVAVVVTALVTGPAPGLVVVEDVQWADDASREALRYLARRLVGRPLLLVLTWRAEELDAAGAAFADALDGLPGTVTVSLERLGASDVAALVATAGAGGWDPGLLAAESEGLPLYVVEALAAGPGVAGEAPHGVRALLHERLASVGETATQVLAAAAVIGRTFDLGTVRAASGRSEDEVVDALEELVRRAIVREADRGGGSVFDFGHARLRDAAYEETG
ncbi:MAG TPA: BTAD domain-containing putative transcriptional regulator, partial [Candidatus Limnocylindrales bacterium]|nr:BTAD domain-containing putative transcriptional regulator [Candidatus Limnocylindrales bacterium]